LHSPRIIHARTRQFAVLVFLNCWAEAFQRAI
jgi:hypothetical protein